MVKKLLKIVSVLILLALIVAGVFFYSIYISVDRVNLSYQTISSPKIPRRYERFENRIHQRYQIQ